VTEADAAAAAVERSKEVFNNETESTKDADDATVVGDSD